MSGHSHPNYVKIWGILVVLLIISVCGPFIGIKWVTLITAFGIAVVKAYLVAKNFMHLNIEQRYVSYLLLTMVGFMFLLFFGVAPDVMRHEGRNWANVAAEEHPGHPPSAIKKAAPAEPVKPAEPVAMTTADKFKMTCAPCHGERGEGNGPAAAALNPKPANFSDPAFWATRDKAHVEKVIREGGGAVGKSTAMAAFGGQFKPQEISELAEYVMGLKQK